MPLPLATLEASPAAFLGPDVLSLFVEAMEMGFLICQLLIFWERGVKEQPAVWVLVGFVFVVACLQSAFSFYTVWRTYVINFGNWNATVDFAWPDRIQSFMTAAMATPVQGFLIWRCWILIHKSWLVLVPLSILLVTCAICSVIVTVKTFQVNFGVAPPNTPLPQDSNSVNTPKVPPDATFILSITCSAVLDVAVTGILLTYLRKSRHNVVSSRFHRVVNRLTILIWEAALPPCICAILTVVTYLTLVNENYYDLTFQAILGKLYVISLFVTLNGRAGLRQDGMATDCIPNMLWASGPPIRVSMVQDPEAQAAESNTSNGSSVNVDRDEAQSIAVDPRLKARS